MWQNRDEDTNCIHDDLIYPLLTQELEKFKIPVIGVTELQDLLNDLKKMGCITRAKGKEGAWWIKEWVRFNY